MKKIYVILLISFLLVPFQYIFAESFADPDDLFSVVTPATNSKVGGIVNIEWRAFDDDQTSIPYYIELLDGATCKNTSFGRINSESAAISSKTANNKILWDTKKTLSTQSLNDGDYCLQICSAFKNVDSFYSICNSRKITVVNVNKLPTISSKPEILTINNSENWEYQLKANDVDSDPLKYYLVFAPDFLEINTSSGLVKTKSGANRIPDGLNIAEYRVVVGVDDSISGTTTQEFTLRVERNRANNTVNPPTQPTTPEPQQPETPENTPSQISFINPKENTEFKGEQNFVEWSVYDPDGVGSVTLNYSSDLETWNEIISRNENNFSRYSWDVSNIADGKYYLQIKVTDKKGESISRTSKPFFVKNIPVDSNELKPLIINVKPENSRSITENITNITGDIVAGRDQQIDTQTFKLSLNDTDLTPNCVVNESGFQCTVKDKLPNGNYTVKAEVSDKNRNKTNFESTFSVNIQTVSDNNSQASNSLLPVVIVIALLLFILIGLPWLFIGYSKRKKQSKVTKNEIDMQAAANYAYPQAVLTAQPPAQQQPLQYIQSATVTSQPQDINQQLPQQNTQNQSSSFNDFMSSYSFNQTQQTKTPIQQAVEQPKLGEVKPKVIEEKKGPGVSDTLKKLTNKVNSFIPKTEVPKIPTQSQPAQPMNDNKNLGQAIQNSYSAGTFSDQKFVEPDIIDTPTQYVTPAEIDQSEEELKKMYPELYGQTTNSDYFEPKPKD